MGSLKTKCTETANNLSGSYSPILTSRSYRIFLFAVWYIVCRSHYCQTLSYVAKWTALNDLREGFTQALGKSQASQKSWGPKNFCLDFWINDQILKRAWCQLYSVPASLNCFQIELLVPDSFHVFWIGTLMTMYIIKNLILRKRKIKPQWRLWHKE